MALVPLKNEDVVVKGFEVKSSSQESVILPVDRRHTVLVRYQLLLPAHPKQVQVPVFIRPKALVTTSFLLLLVRHLFLYFLVSHI